MFKTNWALNNLGHVAAHNSIGTQLNNRINAKWYGTDGAAIQAAIDAAFTAGAGKVYISAGTWSISTTIQCQAGVNIEIDSKAIIIPGADVDMFRLVPGIEITGGFFNTSGVSFTKSVLLLDGEDQFYFTFPTHINKIVFYGAKTGNAIKLKVNKVGNTPNYIFGVLVESLSISRFENGIITEYTDDGGSSWASTNGNMFSDLYFDGNIHSITLSVSSGGNMFNNITLQADENTLDMIICNGSRNVFTNIFIWDFNWQDKACKFSSDSLDNYMVMSLPLTYVDNLGTNQIITTWTSW